MKSPMSRVVWWRTQATDLQNAGMLAQHDRLLEERAELLETFNLIGRKAAVAIAEVEREWVVNHGL